MMLRGKCRDCRERIAWTYPVIEFLTGALFVWWFIAGSFFFRLSQSPFVYIQPLFWLLVGLILITITFSDLIYGLIPDFLVVILGVLALVYRLLLTASGIMQKGDFWFSIYSAVGAFLFFMVLIIATRNRGMGMGDAKLSISLGLLLGWPRVVVGFFTSFMLGAIFALILIVSGKKRFGQTIAFGPFMVLGSFIALVWGSKIWSYYLSFLY